MNKIKRERSANFSLSERDLLVSQHKDSIENKQSDASTWKQKELVWQSMETEFNARSGGAPRSSKTLRIKYECLKRLVRKKSAAIRSELYRTGGGINTAPPLDTTEEQIKSLMKLSADGMESVTDSDVIPQTQDYLGEISMEEFIEIPQTVVDTEIELRSINIEDSKENKANITKTLKPYDSTDTISIVATNETACIYGDSKATKQFPMNEDLLPNSMESAKIGATNGTVSDYGIEINSTPNNMTKTPTSTKWDCTSRKNLKNRKHAALVAGVHKKPIDEFTQRRLELVNLQKQIVEMEMIEKKKEAEFKEKERAWKEEEYTLKLQILKKQLNS